MTITGIECIEFPATVGEHPLTFKIGNVLACEVTPQNVIRVWLEYTDEMLGGEEPCKLTVTEASRSLGLANPGQCIGVVHVRGVARFIYGSCWGRAH